MRALLMAAFAVGAAGPALAETAPDGVWRGTIGKLPVHLCLSASNDGGSYFYLSKKVPIRLESAGGAARWTEKPEGGSEATWTLSEIGNEHIAGTWANADTSLPIALTRVATGKDSASDRPCMSDAFIAPRITAPRLVTRPMHTARLSYTRLDYDVGKQFPMVEISSFQLLASRPGDKAINAALRALVSGPNAAGYVDCMQGAIGLTGTDGDLAMVAEPSFVSTNFVGVEISSSGSCGGAHPYVGRSHRVFDRASGKELDLARWLAPKGMTVRYVSDGRYTDRRITPALRSLVLKAMEPHPDAECQDVRKDAEYWDLALTPKGIVFEPSLPHAMMACGDVAVVPYARLAPFLSPAGKAGAARVSAGIQMP